MSSDFEFPKYGILEATRRSAKMSYNLVNTISAKFGSSITWNSQTRFNSINRAAGHSTLFFKFRGNGYAPIVVFLCEDVELLRQVKQCFPADFEMHDVEVKEGLL